MDTVELLIGVLKQVWYIIPLFFAALIFKSRWFKGVFGEFRVNKLLSQLPEEEYRLVKDVTLPTEDGTTQVDHIVVSKFGIFVIETKNMKGWIFGSKAQKLWTQKIYRHTSKFQNPLHQNYKHVKTLESLLGIDDNAFHSVVVFIGHSSFKTTMPKNVTDTSGCLSYIKSFKEVVLSANECNEIIELLDQIKLKRGIATDIKHRKHVKALVASKVELRVASKEESKNCSRCGSKMVLRETKRGENKGKQFWGCSAFPKCRSVEQFN